MLPAKEDDAIERQTLPCLELQKEMNQICNQNIPFTVLHLQA